jgi:hypothetical protein
MGRPSSARREISLVQAAIMGRSVTGPKRGSQERNRTEAGVARR